MLIESALFFYCKCSHSKSDLFRSSLCESLFWWNPLLCMNLPILPNRAYSIRLQLGPELWGKGGRSMSIRVSLWCDGVWWLLLGSAMQVFFALRSGEREDWWQVVEGGYRWWGEVSVKVVFIADWVDPTLIIKQRWSTKTQPQIFFLQSGIFFDGISDCLSDCLLFIIIVFPWDKSYDWYVVHNLLMRNLLLIILLALCLASVAEAAYCHGKPGQYYIND